VIAVDDGSSDDTWAHIEAVAAQYPGRITPVRMSKNGGKREALTHGFRHARGDVVVTVDSDSHLAPDALRNLVAPLVRDPRVAAVAGKVTVLNRYVNLQTRLLAARFLATFDLARAAQSRFGAVLCTPGALAGYRRTAVLDVLDRWSTQTFLGAACTIGEDRALTTWLLRAGWRSVYQASATVETLMPTTFRGLSRMYIRWERGSIRDDLVMLPVLATRWHTRERWWPTFEIVFGMLQYPIAYAALCVTIHRAWVDPGFLVWVLATIGAAALAQSLYCFRSERGSDFLYGVAYVFMSFFGLQWIYPYSWATLRNGAWLTR
jgi:hyaluronan synthase